MKWHCSAGPGVVEPSPMSSLLSVTMATSPPATLKRITVISVSLSADRLTRSGSQQSMMDVRLQRRREWPSKHVSHHIFILRKVWNTRNVTVQNEYTVADNWTIKLTYFVLCTLGPCAPLHVNADFQCQSTTAVLTWEQRDDVLYYLVSTTLSTGEVATVCNSTTDSCKTSGLKCGVEYAFTVTAYSTYCHSDVSSTVYIQTGRSFYLPNFIFVI